MNSTQPSAIGVELAAGIRAARDELTARWLDRIAARLRIDDDRIFPSGELLDQVPILMVGIADYLEDPQDEIAVEAPVIARAMELGALRFAQGFDASEVLREFELLGGVLFSFCARFVAGSTVSCTPHEVLVCSHRLFRAISVIEQATTGHYLRVLAERVGEREERLRRFNRMITHELKNRVGATLGAGQLLQEEWLGDSERRRFAAMVTDNAQQIQKVVENLIVLSKLDGDRRRQRNIRLREVVNEVLRQLRELARARQVHMRVAGDLPDVEVSAAAVELCLANYLSNSIKYSDPTATERWVEIGAEIVPGSVVHDAGGAPEVSSRDAGPVRLVVRVRDNGRGVPRAGRDRLFERFYRAHDGVTDVEGTGLGLSLVKETVESMGGTAWAEFDDDRGSVFAFAIPCTRDSLTPFSPDGRGDAVSRRPDRRGAAAARASD